MYHAITSVWVVFGLSTPSTLQSTPCWNWNRLVLVSDSFIPKGPWELLWLVQAHRPVFGSVKLAPIKYEKSFVPRHMKSDEGLFWKSTINTAGKSALKYENLPGFQRIRQKWAGILLRRVVKFFIHCTLYVSTVVGGGEGRGRGHELVPLQTCVNFGDFAELFLR